MKKLTTAGCLALALLALPVGISPAQAQFGGCYLAAGAGSQSTNADTGITPTGIPITIGIDGFGSQGVVGSLGGGCHLPLGAHWVLGAELDYTFMNQGSSIGISGLGTPLSASFGYDNAVTGVAKLGYQFQPGTQWYGLAGYTVIQRSGIDVSVPVPAQLGLKLDDLKGFVYGGGVEHKISKNLSLGVEYRHAQLKDDSPITYSGVEYANVHTDTSVDTVMLRLRYYPFASEVVTPAPMK